MCRPKIYTQSFTPFRCDARSAIEQRNAVKRRGESACSFLNGQSLPLSLQVGLRKKLWRRLSPLRLGYLAWTTKELSVWLAHVCAQVSYISTITRVHARGPRKD